jgi:hypothetical protein
VVFPPETTGARERTDPRREAVMLRHSGSHAGYLCVCKSPPGTPSRRPGPLDSQPRVEQSAFTAIYSELIRHALTPGSGGPECPAVLSAAA